MLTVVHRALNALQFGLSTLQTCKNIERESKHVLDTLEVVTKYCSFLVNHNFVLIPIAVTVSIEKHILALT